MGLAEQVAIAFKKWEQKRGISVSYKDYISAQFKAPKKEPKPEKPEKTKQARSKTWKEWFNNCSESQKQQWMDARKSKLTPEQRLQAKRARKRRAREVRLKKRKAAGLPARSEAERIRIRELYRLRAALLTSDQLEQRRIKQRENRAKRMLSKTVPSETESHAHGASS